AVGLKGVAQERTIGDAFEQTQTGATLVDMMALDLLIGSGGVLSHAPRRSQAAHMLIDAFLPEGVTMLAVDSIFMMPQLGVLSEVHEEAATEVFDKDCLIRLGTCIAPVGKAKQGIVTATLVFEGANGTEEHAIEYGSMKVLPLGAGKTLKAEIRPARQIDVGDGPGKTIEREISGGVAGVILDGRGRQPFSLPERQEERVARLRDWARTMGTYPDRFFSMAR
ncbi:glutamate mutase L, partial [Candidatus Fermentibacterales bacterium]|nr:glutamate mutase L [Candidatus Fermentibacterales bacterium]